MQEISLQTLGIVFETMFTTAVPFLEARCDDLAKKCLEMFSGYGLKPTQISVRRRDQVFNYDLSFQLFNGNGTFKISAEKLHISLQNAQGPKDYKIIADCVTKMYEAVPFTNLANSSITATGHAKLSSALAVSEYFLSFTKPHGDMVLTGIIGQPSCSSWPHKIKLLLEESSVYPESVFFSFFTDYPAGKISRQTLDNMVSAFRESLEKCDLYFPKAESSAKG
jgi:hypothetical protein